jgi:hypothetical protein
MDVGVAESLSVQPGTRLMPSASMMAEVLCAPHMMPFLPHWIGFTRCAVQPLPRTSFIFLPGAAEGPV